VWRILCACSGNFVVGASSIRYRRELGLGQAFQVETQVKCWDKQAFYLEHRFVKDGFVHAIVLIKNNVLGPKRPDEIVEILYGEKKSSPEIPSDIQLWIQSNAASSAMLRKSL